MIARVMGEAFQGTKDGRVLNILVTVEFYSANKP